MSLRARAATTLILVAVVLGLGLAIKVHHDPAAGADRATLSWFLDHRTPWATHVETALSAAFAPLWVALATIVVSAGLVLRDRNLDRGARVLGAVTIAGAVAEVFKLGVDRLRPPVVDQLGSPETAASFPSGHVTGTCALVLAVASVVAAGRATRVCAVAAAVLVTGAVAASRLYLGVHWLTDVLASIVVGVAAVVVSPVVVDAGLAAVRPHLPGRVRSMTEVGGRTHAHGIR